MQKTVGPGFPEHVYEESLCVELKLNNIPFTRQEVFSIFCKNHAVGSCLADLVIGEKIIADLNPFRPLPTTCGYKF